MRRIVSMAVTLALGGCASVGEGVTRALLAAGRGEPAEDTRRCEITGAAFPGLEADLRRLPIPRHNALDGGPYLTGASLVARDAPACAHGGTTAHCRAGATDCAASHRRTTCAAARTTHGSANASSRPHRRSCTGAAANASS